MSACNVRNRTIFCDDNIDILSGINSDSIDLIYLDPPFNKNKKFTAPIGSSAEGASFKDIFREDDLKDEWLLTIAEDEPALFHYLSGIKGVGRPYNFAYLAYMAIRLIECRRVLKQTGSIYLHCDPTMSHYLKTTMDCIFGEDKFRNELSWKRTSSHSDAKRYASVSDRLLFYASDDAVWHTQYVSLGDVYVERDYRHRDSMGRYRVGDLTGPGLSDGESGAPWQGYDPGSNGRCWSIPKTGDYAAWIDANLIPGYTQIEGVHDRLDALSEAGLIDRTSTGYPSLKRYLAASKGVAVSDFIGDIQNVNNRSKEHVGYPTQKPLALLERIISASSNEGDIVLDPFCGCATTCIAAENLGRKWVGIDISIKAYELVQQRLAKETASIFEGDVVVDLKTDPPKRTDQDADYREQKYVYVISHPNYPGEYKVGIAKNWQSRLNSYQTSDPERQYKMEFKMETPWFRETERYIHDKFDNKHEWVTGNKDDIINEIRSYKPA